MTDSRSYQIAFIAAILFHLVIFIFLIFEPEHKMAVLVKEAQNDPSPVQSIPVQEQAIKAISMDNQQVMETVNRLKEERLQQKKAEEAHQRKLAQQAEQAKRQRQEEQQRLAHLKEEAAKLALLRKKQLEEEQKHLKQLAKEKEQEEKRLAEMKKQQQIEADQLAQLKQKKLEELAKAMKAKEEKAKAEMEQKRQAALQQAAAEADKRARLAGEVDKYKALIIAAISRQWILPENANKSLSSQFRIRLAPNGAVLEVTLARSSGDPVLDRSAQAAIYKSSPLPVPSDPGTFDLFREISLTVRPENARG